MWSSSSTSLPSLAQPTSGSGSPEMVAVRVRVDPTLTAPLAGPFSTLAGTSMITLAESKASPNWLSVLEPGNGWVRESLYSSDDLGSRAIDERYILESLTKESWWTVSSQLLADNISTEGLLYH